MSRIGKIYSVACNDFVTYDEVIFFPGENLNIIIGPNGTGKSTLVAAIVLGMGGKPELLSRSSALTDWIKHGCHTAHIELNIFHNETNVTAFQRTFDMDGMDEYKIDEKKYSRKQFLANVKKYNIQVDNLCQFLPQDRVQDFAKMNPYELLLNTQLSVCSEEVQRHFQELQELRQKQLDISKNCNSRQKEVEDLQAKNNALLPQIQNIQTREKMMNDLEIGNKKLAWVKYEKLNQKVIEYTNDHNQAQAKLLEAEKKMAPVKKKAQGIITEKKNMETKISDDTNLMQKYNQDLNKQQDQLSRLAQEIRSAKGELTDAISRARERKTEIAQMNQVLSVMKQDLVNLEQQQKPAAEIKAELEQIQRRYREYSQQKQQLQSKRVQIQDEVRDSRNSIDSMKRRILNMEDEKRQKLESLKNRDPNTYQATMWLKENRHMFKGHIYDPIILELRLKEQVNAKFLENTIQSRDFNTFACEDADDMELFLHEMRVKLKLSVNACHAEPADELQFHPSYPANQLRNIGVKMYLIDTIGGPPPILNYLCKIYRLHETPICDESTGMNIDKLPKEIKLFFTPTKRFRITISRYTGMASSSSSDIQKRNWLGAGIDPTILNEQKQKLQEFMRLLQQKNSEVDHIEVQIKEIEDKLVQVNGEKGAIEGANNAIKTAKDKIKRQEQKLQQLMSNDIDIPAERAKFKERARKICANMMRVHEGVNKNLQFFLKAHASVDTQRKKLDIFRTANREIDEQICILQEEINKAKRLSDTILAHVENARKDQKNSEREARKLTDNKHPNDKNFPYKAEFAKLPNGLEDLSKLVTELQVQIDLMGTQDLNVKDEFDRREEQIQSILKAIQNTQASETALQKKIESTHAKWYPEVHGVVKKINENFSRFMTSMSLAGEVELTHQGEYDYSNYGVTIRVKYRAADPMAVLSRTYQSGGERAVAIAIYTMSLQHLTHVPFRCVDEINQGMDPKNERKIFEMLVNETCQPNQSQYFFITPKLLPNLAFNELMNVFIVHNGKFIDDPHVFVKDQLE